MWVYRAVNIEGRTGLLATSRVDSVRLGARRGGREDAAAQDADPGPDADNGSQGETFSSQPAQAGGQPERDAPEPAGEQPERDATAPASEHGPAPESGPHAEHGSAPDRGPNGEPATDAERTPDSESAPEIEQQPTEQIAPVREPGPAAGTGLAAGLAAQGAPGQAGPGTATAIPEALGEPPHPGTQAGTGDGGTEQPVRGAVAGGLLARLTLIPPLLLMALLLAGLPLLISGRFTAPLMAASAVPVAVLLLAAGLTRLPSRWPDTARGRGLTPTPWWSVLLLVAVVAGFAVLQIIEHSEQVVVIRDPGTYLQFGAWIAHHGSLPVSQQHAAFGGAPGLRFDSLGFYQRGSGIVPQFMAGLPMALAAGFWAGGLKLAVLMPALIGACALLTFGGLVARLAGARWAPLAALVLALTLPEQYTTRSTFTEPLAQILLFGGLCLMTDALYLGAARRGVAAEGLGRWPLGYRRPGLFAPWLLAALGGLALGLTAVVRIDGLAEILPAVLFCGLLAAGRRPETTPLALPLAAGLAIGVGYAFADGYLLSRPYLNSLTGSLRPLGYIAAGFGIAAILVALIFVRGIPRMRGRRWRQVQSAVAIAVGVCVVLIVVGFAVRPPFQTVRGETNPLTISSIARFQRLDRLPIDPTRQYSEDSLYWVIWYIGVPALVLGTFGAALLARQFLRGRARTWGLPLMIIGWSTVVTLWRPAITPDQPWASRRLVPVVLPGIVLLATWTSAWLLARARERGTGVAARSVAASCCAIAMLLPAVVTTFGLGLERDANGGIKAVASGLALKRTYGGEVRQVDDLCRAIGPNASVLILDRATADRFSEIIRGTCGLPTARMSSPSPALVQQAVPDIIRAGRRPVLVAADPDELAPYGGGAGMARQALALATRQDEHTLMTPPSITWRFSADVWIYQP